MTMAFSQACENNKLPILAELKRHLAHCHDVLEIGSGTGQHSVYFAPGLPHLRWHCSDVAENHPSIVAWQQEYPADNLLAPQVFKVGRDPWPNVHADAVFSANTAHIMQPLEVQTMLQLIGKNLAKGGVFCQYGPFNINGHYTSESNERFDQHLLNEGYGGIRDIAELKEWGTRLSLVDKIQMPANNLLLVWHKD
jgi:SAM-dependent methyltransferase